MAVKISERGRDCGGSGKNHALKSYGGRKTLTSAVGNLLLMDHSHDTNAAIWHSEEAVQAWAAEAQAQERHRAEHRRFMAALLPFGPQEAFTFLDLGAGTGAASRDDPRPAPGQHRDPR